MADFGSMITSKDWRATREEREDLFVIDAISRILKVCEDEPGVARKVLREASEGVTPIWFNDTFTDFPYRLSVHQVFSPEPGLRDVVFLNEKSKFFKLWTDDGSNWPAGTSRIMIFKYGRIGTWVLCNEEIPCPKTVEGTCVQRTVLDDAEQPHHLWLAPFDTFLEGIGLRWTLQR